MASKWQNMVQFNRYQRSHNWSAPVAWIVAYCKTFNIIPWPFEDNAGKAR